MKRTVKLLQATVIAGLFFLLPFVVVGYILVSIYSLLHPFMERLAGVLGTADLMVVRLMVVGSMVLVCLLAGMLVRSSFTGRLGRAVDEGLAALIPGYDALRLRIASALGHAEDREIAVLIRDGDMWCPARLVERGPGDECVVFVPDSPSGTSGAVIVIASEDIRTLSISYGQLLRRVRNGGRGLAKDLEAS